MPLAPRVLPYLPGARSGTVAIWGHLSRGYAGGGYFGEITYNTSTPRLMPFMDDVVSVGWGFGAVVMCKGDGTVWTCGGNGLGQAGLGYEAALVVTPAQVHLVAVGHATPEAGVDVQSTGAAVMVLCRSGRVLAWGGNERALCGSGDSHGHARPEYVESAEGSPLEGIVQMSVGKDGAMFLDSEGNVWVSGLLAIEGGTLKKYAERLSKVWPALKPLDNNVAEIGTGFSVSVARLRSEDEKGTLWTSGNNNLRTWGDNSYGQWGVGTITEPKHPEEAQVLNTPTLTEPCRSLGVGLYHVIAILQGGTAVAWGRNNIGQCGVKNGLKTVTSPTAITVDGTPTGAPLESLAGAHARSDIVTGSANEVGAQHSAVWNHRGEAWCFGGNVEGELGNGTWILNSDVPVATVGGLRFKRIFCSEVGCIAVVKGGDPAPLMVYASQGPEPASVTVHLLNNLPGDRITGWTGELQRAKVAPAFKSKPQAPGNPTAHILKDPGNGNALTLVEFVTLPVQGEGVLYGRGLHGENGFTGASAGIPVSAKEGQPIGELIEAITTEAAITELRLAEPGLVIALKSNAKIELVTVNPATGEEVNQTWVLEEAEEVKPGALVLKVKKLKPNFNYPVGTQIESFKLNLIPKKASLIEKIQPGDPAYKAGAVRWRLSAPALLEVTGEPQQLALGGELKGVVQEGWHYLFTLPLLNAKGEPNTSYTFSATQTPPSPVPPPALWPRPDSELAIRVTGIFTPAEPSPNKPPVGTGTLRAAVEYVPALASDGQPEPGWLFRYTRRDPYLAIAGKNTRGAYATAASYAVADWVYLELEGEPVTGWVCKAPVASSSSAVDEPPFAIEARTPTSAINLKLLNVLRGASRLAVGQTLLSSAYPGGQTKIVAKLSPSEWETEAAASSKLSAKVMLVPVNATYGTYWEEKPLHYETKTPEDWGNLDPAPGTPGTPQTSTLVLTPWQTGTTKNPGSPPFLEGNALSKVEIQGSWANPRAVKGKQSRFGTVTVYTRFAAANDVPAEILPPTIVNVSRPGKRPKTGDTLEAVPGTWTGEDRAWGTFAWGRAFAEGGGSWTDPAQTILERRYQWATNWSLEDEGGYTEKGTAKTVAEGGNKYVVEAGDKGFSILLLEYVRSGAGWCNTGACSERSREVQE